MLSVPKMSVSVMGCCVALVVVLIVGAIAGIDDDPVLTPR